MHEAFNELNVVMPMKELEDSAVLVHRAMTLKTRHFHTLKHVFSFTSEKDPIQSLAALFHDIVYFQVDEGFIPEIQTIINPYIRMTDGVIALAPLNSPEDLVYQLTLEVFNFSPGDTLSPYLGLNEFLSALVLGKKLQGRVSDHDLIRMIVCIEATIPFQGKNEKGESHFDILEKRLERINEKYHCCMDQDDIVKALQLAVTFSNKDVESFSEKYAGRFLDNTWKLLPETNVALRSAEIYSIREYRQALFNMENFFTSLNPDHVFNQYHGVPSIQNYHHIVNLAHQNVITAREYMHIKLLSAAILEALAEISGGDAPLSLFSEDIRDEKGKIICYEDYLPPSYPSIQVEPSSVLYKLFNEGRPEDTTFDIKNSPLSLFLYSHLEQTDILRLLRLAKRMFSNEMSPSEFLRSIDQPIVSAIAEACAHMVLTRREKLFEFIRSL